MSIKLGDRSVGDVVYVEENGLKIEYIIVHQGNPSISLYDSSCEGTWLLRKDVDCLLGWIASSEAFADKNSYEDSLVHAYLNGTFLNRFSAATLSNIKTAKIPYRPSFGKSTAVNAGSNGLTCRAFSLSGYELGFTSSDSSYFVADGAKLDYFLSGSGTAACDQRAWDWPSGTTSYSSTRTPYIGSSSGTGLNFDDNAYAWFVTFKGACYWQTFVGTQVWVRPTIIMNPSAILDAPEVPKSAPTPPSYINVPSSIKGGESISISWGSSTDADGDLGGILFF